ncbi:type II toxin-antitoxin system HicB family antitoxin [Patescibacteria group bacterium]|nr:type II toxin-antitoxin system HicB family antitoxin [Patescibacteria group bacterium]
MKIYTFRVIIEPDEKNTFHGYVPALPGCHTWGESLEKTKKNLKDAIQAYIESLKADREPIPEEQGLEFFESISEKELKPVKKSAAYV